MGSVPLNLASHDSMVRDLQSMRAVREMLSGKGATDLLDQLAKQHEQIVLRIPDDLELVASRTSIAKLESIESDSRPEQMGAEVEFVDFACAINETYRFKLGVFESLQPHGLGHFLIEAWEANLPVSAFHRAVVGNLKARCDLATAGATNLLVLSGLGGIHACSL